MKSKDRNFSHTISEDKSPGLAGKSVAFTGKNERDFAEWRESFRHGLMKELKLPKRKVPLRPEIVERNTFENHIREKVVYDLEEGLSVVAWICRPKKKTNAKCPAVLCCHGHGPGKDPLVGLYRGEACLEYHKMVAVRLAEKGFVTLVPDRRGYGDCSQFVNGFPDIDDLRKLDAFYRRKGSSLLSLDIVDSIRAIDLLNELDMVDPEKTGCLGIETGATVAACLGAVDERVKAVSLTSFISLDKGMPGISCQDKFFARVGTVDICSLIAPRPLLLQIPVADPVVPAENARKAIPLTKKIYTFFHAEEKCVDFEFDGVLELDYQSLEDWFVKWS